MIFILIYLNQIDNSLFLRTSLLTAFIKCEYIIIFVKIWIRIYFFTNTSFTANISLFLLGNEWRFTGIFCYYLYNLILNEVLLCNIFIEIQFRKIILRKFWFFISWFLKWFIRFSFKIFYKSRFIYLI